MTRMAPMTRATRMTRRLTRAALVAAALTAIVAAPAGAHVTANPDTATAGGFARFAFRVSHGCDGAATNVVSIAIPDGVVSVKPEMIPFWDAETVVGELDEPVELHGEQITEGVTEVTWTAQDGHELPDDRFAEFGLSVRLPETAGVVHFPAIQECVNGEELRWIEIPAEGQDAHELESPAPAVTVTAAEGRHGDAGATGAGVDEANGADALVITALVAGLLGVVLGAASFATARRRTPGPADARS